MKNTKTVLLAFLTLIFSSAAFGQTRVGGKVIEIIDGRTVVIQTSNNSRLMAELQYIEVPEAAQPFHQIAKDHLQTLVLDKRVEFRARGLSETKTVGQLLLNGIDVSQQMIRDGAAWYAILQKDAQDYSESRIYQSNEAQAKNEKIGVWSVADLKPSWEIRAGIEEDRRRQQRIAEEKAAAEAAKMTESLPAKPKPVVRKQLNNESQMWADIPETIGKSTENVSSAGGLIITRGSKYNSGIVATPPFKLEVLDKDNRQAVVISILYIYGDDRQGKKEEIYMIHVQSESRDWSFLKFNELTATADSLKINFGKAKRVGYEKDSGKLEILSYQVKRSDLSKLVDAGNLSVKVGTFSTKVSSDIQMMLGNLLNAAK